MRKIALLLSAALVVGVVALLLVLSRGEGETPDAPGVRAATPPEAGQREDPAARRRGPPPPGEPTTGTPSPAPADAPEPWIVRVRTNVPHADVTLRVELCGGEPDPEALHRRSDAEGLAEFEMPALDEPLHQVVAEARAEGFAPAEAQWEPKRGDAETKITLVPGVAVRGRLVSTRGTAVAKAEIAAGEARGESDEHGEFEIHVPSPGDVTLTVSHPAHRPLDTTVRAPAEALVVTLDPGLSVSGRVTFPDGKPAPGARVRGPHELVWADTDADGRYVLWGLPEGPTVVHCGLAKDPRPATAGDTGVDFVADRHLVRMRFVDEHGRPFRNTFVVARGLVGDETAFYSAGWEGPGVWEEYESTGVRVVVQPSAGEYVAEVAEVALEGPPRLHDIPVVLRRNVKVPTGSIALHVVDDVATPLRRVLLTLENRAGRDVAGFGSREVLLDEDGRALLEEVPAGDFHAELSAQERHFSPSGYGLPDARDVRVPPGGRADLEGIVGRGGRVRVTVRSAAGEILAPERLDLLDTAGERIAVIFLRVRDDGGWTTELKDAAPGLLGTPVPAGRYVVKLTREGAAPVTQEVYIAPAATTDVTITVE